MKICANCKEEKPLSQFSTRNRKLSDGTVKIEPLCYCKQCNTERSSEWYYSLKSKEICFVYRILDKNGEVIYVGKTESLPNRANQHFRRVNSHLNKKANGEMERLQYIAMSSIALMDIKEIYYINLYKPK